MFSFRLVAPLAVAGALGIAAPAFAATTGSHAVTARTPVAHAAGGGAAVDVYPSVVNVRLVRAEAALERLSALVDEGQPADPAHTELIAARSNTSKGMTRSSPRVFASGTRRPQPARGCSWA